MKRINNFNEFTNESFRDMAKAGAKILKGVTQKFKNASTYLLNPFKLLWQKLLQKYGENAWWYLAKHLQKIGFLKKYGVEFLTFSEGDADIALERKTNEKFDDIIDITQCGEQIDHMFEHLIKEGARRDFTHPNPKVPNVTPNELFEELLERFDDDKERSVLVWGAPGLGKTQIVKNVGRTRKADVFTFTLSQRDPTDFIGLPFTMEQEYVPEEPEFDEGGVPKSISKRFSGYALPTFFPLNNGKNDTGGILFFDEMNRARQSVLGAAMQLFLEHSLDDYQLPSKWVVWAAANRATDEPNATPTKLGAAMSQRIAHINLVPSLPDWEQWAKKTGRIHPDVLMFVRATDSDQNSVFHDIPDSDEEEGPNPTPRSWEFASNSYKNVLKAFNVKGMVDFSTLSTDKYRTMRSKIFQKLAMEVGNVIAGMFAEFLDVAQEISPEELKKVYSNPDKAPINNDPKTGKPMGPGRTYALMNLVANAIKDRKLTKEELVNYFKWMERIAEVKKDKSGEITSGNEEIATACLGLLKDYHPYLIKPVAEGGMSKDWAEVTKNWNKIVDKTFSAAGE